METEKRRKFIIDFFYFAIWLGLAFLVLKYGLPLIAPFVFGFLVAFLLKNPIDFLAKKTHLKRSFAAIITVLLFFATIGLLLVLASFKVMASLRELFFMLPQFYTQEIAPFLLDLSREIEDIGMKMDPSLVTTLTNVITDFVKSLGSMISNLSVTAVSAISGYASSLPSFFIKLLLMIISSFFISADYYKLTGFLLRQMPEKARDMTIHIKEYVVGTLFACIRSYALIMTITFVELSIGLSIIQVDNAILIALLIAIFDVLPVLGTGGIMIPWALISLIQANYPLAVGLIIIYLIITVIRNIIEPKIVGSQVGLHPVVTLVSMFVGAQLFGVLGLFGFPITLSLLNHLNETGIVKIFK